MANNITYSDRTNDNRRLKRYYSGKASKSRLAYIGGLDTAGFFHVGFSTESDFVNWWQVQYEKQDGRCYYCKSKFEIIAKLIELEKLGKRRVRGGGYRGQYPEIDRVKPRSVYSRDNCVLVCYPCNNDKSYVYLDNKWADFIGPARKDYFEYLAMEAGLVTL